MMFKLSTYFTIAVALVFLPTAYAATCEYQGIDGLCLPRFVCDAEFLPSFITPDCATGTLCCLAFEADPCTDPSSGDSGICTPSIGCSPPSIFLGSNTACDAPLGCCIVPDPRPDCAEAKFNTDCVRNSELNYCISEENDFQCPTGFTCCLID